MVNNMSYNKLVRDKIPEIIESNGEVPITRVLNDNEYKQELEKKLLEEYHEVLEASGSNRIEELSDMLEVISALAQIEGECLDTVIEVARQKTKKRGGFEKKIYLIGVKKNK